MNEQLRQLYGYLYGMWRYRWSALFITWVAAILGWVVVLTLPDIYKVKAVVYIDTTSVMTPLLKGLATESDSRDELAVMTRVLLSRKNLLSLIKDTDMDLEVNTPAEKEVLLLGLSRDIAIKGGAGRGKDNNIYELSYSNKNPNRAYQIVSGLLNTMIENTLSSNRTDNITAQKFMDAQIGDYEERLVTAEQKLAEFKKENFGFMPDEKGNYYSRLHEARSKIEGIQSSLKLAKKRIVELNKQLSGETPLINSQTYEGGVVTKLQQMEGRLKELLVTYTGKHPDVLALMALIKNEKARSVPSVPETTTDTGDSTVEFNPVYQELKVEANKAKVEVGILKTELEYRQRAVEKLTGYIDIIPEVEAKLTRLNRDYNITKRRYLDLVDRREASKLAESASKSSSDITFRVIEQPIVPITPSGPPRMLYLAGALVVALGAGLAWGFLRFMLAPTFFDIRQLAEKTGMPTLGTVSLYLFPQHRARRRVQLFSFLAATSLLVVAFSSTILFHEQGTVWFDSLLEILTAV